MNHVNIPEKRINSIVEAVGSHDELARALRVRYYRTACPAEIGRTLDPPDLSRNLLIYSSACKEKRWPLVVLRPELERTTWGVMIMLPPRAFLDIDVNPSKLAHETYTEARAVYKDIFTGCRLVSVVGNSYHVYQGLTIKAGEVLAFHMSDVLCRHTGAISDA